MMIRVARQSDAPTLSALALQSKQLWGYSQEFMNACEEELTVAKDDIICERFDYLVAEERREVVGFCALEQCSTECAQLEALFVRPDNIGSGVGRHLFIQAVSAAQRRKMSRVLIQSDPNAKPFYLAMGCQLIGEKESESVPGRMLPLLEYILCSD